MDGIETRDLGKVQSHRGKVIIRAGRHRRRSTHHDVGDGGEAAGIADVGAGERLLHGTVAKDRGHCVRGVCLPEAANHTLQPESLEISRGCG